MTIKDYYFQDRLLMSTGAVEPSGLETFLLARFPAATSIERAHLNDDKRGIDLLVYRDGLRPLGVDKKVREADCRTFGNDDLALETWSVIETGAVGWTRDSRKAADYILWHWLDTGRLFLVAFPPLCAIFQRRWEEWQGTYPKARQSSDGGRWHSECVYVPRKTVISALNGWCGA